MKTISLIALCLLAVLLSAQVVAAQTTCTAQCCMLQTGATTAIPDNTLTDNEKAAGWQLLFDGKSFKGWGFTDSTPGAWVLQYNGMKYTNKAGAYAYTEQTFGNFEFKADFMVAKGTNSGIFFRWANLGDPVQTGFEMQVLDSGGKTEVDKHVCGALYDAKAPTSNEIKPPMEWNTADIKCLNSWIVISVNGKTVVAADLNNWTTAHLNPDGTPNKYGVALKDWARTGHIGFQAHGGIVWYKNVKIRSL